MSSFPIVIKNLQLSDPEDIGLKKTMAVELDKVIEKFIVNKKIQGAVVAIINDLRIFIRYKAALKDFWQVFFTFYNFYVKCRHLVL